MSDVQPRRPGDAGGDSPGATTWVPAELPPELALPPIDGAVTLDDDLAALRITGADAGPADDAATGGEPADGSPADGSPADGSPADGSPADGSPADGEPADGSPADGEPADGSPAAGEPADGAAGGLPAAPRIPTDEEMRRALSDARPAAKKKTEGDGRGPLIGGMCTLLALLGPVQVVTGGSLLWLIALAAGGALVVVGGPEVIRSAASRGAAPLGPLIGLVVGVLVVVGCAVAMGVGVQQFATRPEPVPTVDVSAPYGSWQPAQ